MQALNTQLRFLIMVKTFILFYFISLILFRLFYFELAVAKYIIIL